LRNRDEQRERRKYKSLSERRRLASVFINGRNLPRTQAAFRAAVQQLETSPASAEVFQLSVPPLGADQFVATSSFSAVLRPDGSLAHAPPVLVGAGGQGPLDSARLEVERLWRETLQMVGSDALIPQEHVDALRRVVGRWQRLAADNFARADSLARLQGTKYLRSLTALVRAVEDPNRRRQLQSYYAGSGTAFEGGTVADLVHHVLAKNLSTQPGSRAHLIFAELGHDMLRDMDGQIQLADQRVEYYKLQNQGVESDRLASRPRLPQRAEAPAPGNVSTSVERLRQILGERTQPTSRDANVGRQVTWRK
jgi:hypothetical protein